MRVPLRMHRSRARIEPVGENRLTTSKFRTKLCLAVSLIAFTAFVAGCGKASETAPTTSSEHEMPMADGSMGMTSLFDETIGDVSIGMSAMDPERFFVSVGAEQREHKPAPDDDIHLMATLSDSESGIRLPDAAVTVRVTGPDGKVAYDGPLYPMIGRGMGMHYGENVSLGRAGRYTAEFVATPPRIGRHADSEGAWSQTIRFQAGFDWDGASVGSES